MPISTIRNAPAASLVCKVLKTKWPVNEAWMAFSAVSRSRFHPREQCPVAEGASQGCSKRETDFGVNLNLVDAVQLILHRVFGGDDLVLRAANLQQEL